MKKQILLGLSLLMLLMGSCKEEVEKFENKGNCNIISFSGPESAYMGDSINFQFNINNAEIHLNQARLQLFFGKQIVSERFMNIQEAGEYQGKLLVPFLKDVKDGTVSAKLRIQNERFDYDEKSIDISVKRPIFKKLTLRTSDGNAYTMYPTQQKEYEYAVKAVFSSDLFAKIEAEKSNTNGNKIVWGSLDGKISNEGNDLINFSSDIDGEYQITFNTLTYEGSPFIKFALNGNEFEKIDNNNFKVEREFKQGEIIEITGLKADYDNYWINPAFFAKIKGTNGKKLKFLARDGKYRLTVIKESNMKYFKVDVLNVEGTDIGMLHKGDDAIWCVGDGSIGFPSYRKNGINWNPSKAICLAPLGNGKHRIIFEAGTTIGNEWFNFKFFSGPHYEAEFRASSYKTQNHLSPFFRIDTGEDGNIKPDSEKLEIGKFYAITVDISKTNSNSDAIISVDVLNKIEEVDMPLVEP